MTKHAIRCLKIHFPGVTALVPYDCLRHGA